MKHLTLLLTLFPLLTFSQTVLLEDQFNREESDAAKEEVGGEWETNSKSRAKGVKQVDLVDGAMHITRAEVADHGVSVRHPVEFKDATITLRFKLGAKDDLGINLADPEEKSVHAGHICMTRIRPYRVDINDLKTGNMNLEMRKARQAKTVSPAQKKLLDGKTKQFKTKFAPDEWHDLKVQVAGETMTVSIDGKQVGSFTSEGIGHPTKRLLRIAVGKQAWVDDLKVTTP